MTIERKPIFDAVRIMLGRGFKTSEVRALDAAIDRALGIEPEKSPHRLGALSERYESGGNGPGTVSTGRGDPGGVSYGLYQLASRTGTAGAFVKAEGSAWPELAKYAPGTRQFSNVWQGIADRQPDAFTRAQHAFIKRTHYDPAVAKVRKATGVDLDKRHAAVRDAVWSVAVQHGGAAKILIEALGYALRDDDDSLINAIYDAREAYVSRLRTLPAKTLNSLLNRYRQERKDALGMLRHA